MLNREKVNNMNYSKNNTAVAYDKLGNQIDNTLASIDYKSLFAMADFHDKQSTIIRARAQKLAEREYRDDAVKMRVEFIRKLPTTVMRYIKRGHSADHACKLTADHTGVRLQTVLYRWDDFLNDKQQKVVKQRNALALELHSLGFTNVNIADRLNLHAVTVSRILKKQKELRYHRRNPDRIKLFSERTENKNIFSISSVRA